MSDYTELLIGAGSNHTKLLAGEGESPNWNDLTTLDFNADHKPDVLWDLTEFPYPFEDGSFDTIHGYEVLEHLGQQGDFKQFFGQFSEFWRILKPNGTFVATVPWWQSEWAWGDPSHTRVIQPQSLTFLSQQEYAEQVGKTPMSDFRFMYKADFQILYAEHVEDTFAFVLRALKTP